MKSILLLSVSLVCLSLAYLMFVSAQTLTRDLENMAQWQADVVEKCLPPQFKQGRAQ